MQPDAIFLDKRNLDYEQRDPRRHYQAMQAQNRRQHTSAEPSSQVVATGKTGKEQQ
jgi:hypothetical protein